mmetsp:Transcript_4254/g.4936  ORF Transcript_4254/g.4936 Transcript_4254/m.4936 type:complete len:218 (+) Transcript_4254:89-742(+)|eukprot:CAMPEP_0184066172 /NCGR_PEP_ID=MMETSP0957-20130417/3278_1 /TAXON_ID=627963 /ORGANISM="Aplanochytrium sp, Strain PBS07" /LENGTH=217 /DNA_ID=CAMNT_0026364141 /DNA_START=74 /DNA_END=724 /DNA_ORIENTATION=+
MYAFKCSEAASRWKTRNSIRVVDRSLGYPILVVGEDGSYEIPDGATTSETLARSKQLDEATHAELLKDGFLYPGLYNGPGVEGTGVFTGNKISAGSFLGSYNGLVMTYEDAEMLSGEEEHFLFVLNDGENGVAVDGNYTNANALKYINHSCDPNVEMREIFANGSWNIAVIAIKEIQASQEILHDFNLHTEDPSKQNIPCLCGSHNCRQKLFRYFEW